MAQDIRIPNDLWTNLMLLHSYIIVKIQMKRSENMKAARMLLRVADTISSFPAHVVNILTSTVVACWKAQLKEEGTSYAMQLMRPEYRSKVDAKYKAKIEKIVRKPDKSTLPEEMTQSPYTDSPEGCIAATTLMCPVTQNIIPYCIVTGEHMVKDNWSICHICQFPALYTEFQKLLQTETACPMCSEELSPDQITKVDDPSAFLRKFKMLTSESGC
jgi:WD repeat-containing protein 19